MLIVPDSVKASHCRALVRGANLARCICLALLLAACGSATHEEPAKVLTSITLSASPLTFVVGQSANVSVTGRDQSGGAISAGTVTFTSSAPTIATVTSNGATSATVTGVAAGQVQITASTGGLQQAVSLTVTPAPVARVTVAVANPTPIVGTTTQASAITADAAGQTLTGRVITWSSSAASVATVSATGIVSAVAVGTTTIQASSEGIVGVASVTVRPVPVATVTVSLSPTALNTGQVSQGVATARDAANNVMNGLAVTWSSSNTTVATVSSTGRVTGTAAGQTTITATIGGTIGSAALTVATAPTDGRAQTLASVLQSLPGYITSETAYNQSLIANNPSSATLIQAKIVMLQQSTLAAEIANIPLNAMGVARSQDGRNIPIVSVFPRDSMRAGAAASVGILQLELPVLEGFYGLPIAVNDVRLFYGFTIGNRGGNGSIFSEDEGTYISRTPESRLPFEAIIDHELGHTYMGNESMNQFTEMYVYNVVRTGSTDLQAWTFTRSYAPQTLPHVGVHLLLDVYSIIGVEAMKQAYRACFAIRPPYGDPIPAACIAAFVDRAPAASKVQVETMLKAITF